MLFTPSINKQATELHFPRRLEKNFLQPITFNSDNVWLCLLLLKKHFDLMLDIQLSFNEHVGQKYATKR